MGLRGSVKAFSLDQLLKFLNASSHVGALDVFHLETRKRLYLYRGGLYFDQPSDWRFRLGDSLVRTSSVTPAQVEAGLALQQESGGERLLGDCLIELGHATEATIQSARRYQVEEEIFQLFGWEDAFFEFQKDQFPEDFDERLKGPEQFRFEVGNVLMEAVRRIDEWAQIQETLPSEKRLYVLSKTGGAAKRVSEALEEAGARVVDAESVFNGRTSLSAYPKLLGLNKFETSSVLARLIGQEDVRSLYRGELESRFKTALKDDLDYAIALYECALETPEFEGRGRFLDRVFFGSDALKARASEGSVSFSAQLRGRRAFQVLLGLFRQGVPCEFSAKEEDRTLRLAFSKTSLVWRVEEGETPPSIVKHLLARSPVSASDLVRVREMQQETGRTLQQLLVGGGYVTMDNWFRAQKDTVLNEMFKIFFKRRPYIEVRTGEARSKSNPGMDIDLPLLPWLHAEVMKEIREWETMVLQIPSVRAFLVLTPKGRKAIKGANDPLLQFDGQHSLEEVLKATPNVSPQEFLTSVYANTQSGRLAPLEADDYRKRLDAVLEAGKRPEAINICMAALTSRIDVGYFTERLKALRADEAEVKTQDKLHTLRGDLASFSLAEVMQSFSVAKRSGTLRVEAKSDTESNSRQIYFDSGDIYLLSGDMEEELDEADLEAGLVAAGLITLDEVSAAAATQMKDEVYEMFLWEGAEFEFTADHLPTEFYESRANRKILLNTNSFLLGAVRRIAEWEAVRKTLPSDDLVLCFDSSMSKMKAVREKGSEDLLIIVDGRHCIADLVRMSRIRRFRALTLLAELVSEGSLNVVDLEQIQEDDEDALFASELPTSGVIEEGFVGQMQFVGTLQDWASAGMTGIMRVTDGRRSKELALVDGQLHRTSQFVSRAKAQAGVVAAEKSLSPEAARVKEIEAMDLEALPEDQRGRLDMELRMLRMVVASEEADDSSSGGSDEQSSADRLAELEALDLSELTDDERAGKEFEIKMMRAAVEMEEEEKRRQELEALSKESAVESAQETAECFSWHGVRFELLKGTLPPRLLDPKGREERRLDTEAFFDTFAEAGEQWVRVGEIVPKDKWLVYANEDAREEARLKAEDMPELADMIGENTAEDIARMSGRRYRALSWAAALLDAGLVTAEDPSAQEGDAAEDWDFSL